MWQSAPPLAVSSSERAILETIRDRIDLPVSVRVRARIVLLAGEGKANHEIGQDLNIARTRVLRWRGRFQQRRWPEDSEKLSGGSAPILIESGWQTFRRENRRETKLPHPG
jgi:hypothetical protein